MQKWYGSKDILVHSDKMGKTELFKAVETSDIDLLKKRIAAGDDVNKCTTYGDSPLQVALCYENILWSTRVELAKILLENGANINYIPTYAEDRNTVAMMFFKALEKSTKLDSFTIKLMEYADFSIKNAKGETISTILESKYKVNLLNDISAYSESEHSYLVGEESGSKSSDSVELAGDEEEYYSE